MPPTQNNPQTFDLAYGSDPWSTLTTNQRAWYDPILRDVYRKLNVFGQFTNFKQNLGAVNATDMTITSLFDLHPNTNPIGLRDMWMPSSHLDSRNVKVHFSRYGGKVSYGEYDDLITYWRESSGSGSALRTIMSGSLGRHLVDTQDMLSRNALLQMPYQLFPNNRANFSALVSGDIVTTPLLDQVHLGMQNRDVPGAQGPDATVGTIVAVISPGVMYDLQQQSTPKDWISKLQYTHQDLLFNYELGTFRNVRFVVSPKCTLFNSGTIRYQANVTSAINAGDGSPSGLVDNTWTVGQSGASHYIQLDPTTSSAAMANYTVNEVVTIHTSRTNANGVTNGVDYADGTLHNRRIVSVDVPNCRIALDQPIMIDMTTNLGSGVYAYATVGTHVHASIFLGGSDAVVMGVGRPPRLHTPPPVDDFEGLWRFSWDSFQGYSTYNPNVCEVLFSTATYRGVGATVSG